MADKDEGPVRDADGLTSQDHVLLGMLGDDLKHAIIKARGHTGDASITCRIGEIPGGGAECPPGFVPGLVSIHRDGHQTHHGLSPEKALAALGKLKP